MRVVLIFSTLHQKATKRISQHVICYYLVTHFISLSNLPGLLLEPPHASKRDILDL